MFNSITSILLSLSSFLAGVTANPLEERQSTCTFAQKKAAVAAEIQTIRSHSAADAAKIPLNSLASRTFYVTHVSINECLLETTD